MEKLVKYQFLKYNKYHLNNQILALIFDYSD